MKRFEVLGPYRRRNQPKYWVVFDTFKKHVVERPHPRKSDAVDEAMRLEDEHNNTDKVEDVS